MSIRKTVEAAVRANRHGEVTLTFTAVCAGGPERDPDGTPLRFGIPLAHPDTELAELVRGLTRWVVDLYAQEVQAQREAVQQATARREVR
jgi:hypothetical protein